MKKIQLNKFKANEVWIIFNLDKPLLLENDEQYEVFIIMDVASTYVFGHILLKKDISCPDPEDLNSLFMEAWSAKREWAKKVIVPENMIYKNNFKELADLHGIAFLSYPLAALDAIVNPLKKSFSECF